MRSKDRERMRAALAVATLATASVWPAIAAAQDDANREYLFHSQFAEHCKRAMPPLSKQIDSAFSAWQSRIPAQRLAAIRDYAGSKAGKRMAESYAIGISVASGDNKLVASYQCVERINEWGRIDYPSVTNSQIDAAAAKPLLASIAPLALARLDCAALEGVSAAPATAASADQASVPVETWTFSGCGRSHAVGIDRRSDRLGLAGKDRIALSGF
jgi:hypothetical protein